MKRLEKGQVVRINKGGKHFGKYFYISNVGQLGMVHCIRFTKGFKVDKRIPLRYYDKQMDFPSYGEGKSPFYANIALDRIEFFRNGDEPAFDIISRDVQLPIK